MTDNAQATAVPGWVLKFMDAIDTLEFGEGFAPLSEDTDMFFGTAHIHGVEAIKEFFIKIDAPLNITHEVLEFWTAGDGVRLLRGEATMARKTEPTKWCAPRSCTSSTSTRKSRFASGHSASPRARFRPMP
ncbi:nuclear transport factor 2 family protein [Streptomyces sp. NBC_00271]|uniref:nuclear transport factor 2 family protein n=1 Tax=Streptomyces sp. NBC_00271 TaxID=2975697 RepID=UPI002E2CADBF|nr:nuclear transport factor 2 family protein [Streptomyces sp. NBC_00271]